MDLEEYLHELRFEFMVGRKTEEDSKDIIEKFLEKKPSDSFERIKNLIGKIMGTIQVIRSKIDIGF